jgi:simple sugar transport system substrate-binding protein
MIRVGAFGSKVPRSVQDEVLQAQKAVASGKLNPFHASAEVLDNEGRVVIPKGATLSDEQILNMNWLAAGVQGKIAH